MIDEATAARFWARVDRSGGPDACWEWRGAQSQGYGVASVRGISASSAHRIAYLLTNGGIAPGLILRHRCDNALCCNPSHLIPGTHQENADDRVVRGRGSRGPEHAQRIKEGWKRWGHKK